MGRFSLLLVEDQAVIALELEAVLHSAGYHIGASVPTVWEALHVLTRWRPDAAVLDVRLGAELGFAVADELQEVAVPFLFLTGQRRDSLPPQHRSRPLLSKPCLSGTLLRAVAHLVAKPGTALVARSE